MAKKCVDGKVIVVTGAGRGIGREIAMLAAAEGAMVVVNDLGGSAEGEGADVSVADQVVAEIKKAGGIAVSNGDSVADPQGAERIIKTAIDNFGRIGDGIGAAEPAGEVHVGAAARAERAVFDVGGAAADRAFAACGRRVHSGSQLNTSCERSRG